KIRFASRDSGGPGWEVPVTARVVAKAWAAPQALELSYDQDNVLEPSLALYHDAQTRIGAIVSNSPAIQVETERRSPEHVQVDLAIRPPPMTGGETWEQTLQVFEEGTNSELLRIPVRVTCRPELRCAPREIALSGPLDAADRFEKTVVVFLRSAG